jgi:hypothetical protein
MPRISNAKPMQAYDYVANLLKQANGGDSTISRDDAKALVAELKKNGQGTAALAARNIFKLVDARDTGPGARVTAYDLDRDRKFVQEKMIENRDINKNGLARDEIAKMSPTGRALVELGQVIAMEKPKARIAYDVPQKGLDYVTKLLKEAAKRDPITSRADVTALARELNTQGRGTEALAVATFFAFVDFRDEGKGSRITAKDLDKANAYASEKLLKGHDANKNGYSAADVATFSKSAKAFLLLGQMIEAGILKA